MPRPRKSISPKKRVKYEDDDDYIPKNKSSHEASPLKRRTGEVETAEETLRSKPEEKPKFIRQHSVGSEEMELSSEPVFKYTKESPNNVDTIDLSTSPIIGGSYTSDVTEFETGDASKVPTPKSNDNSFLVSVPENSEKMDNAEVDGSAELICLGLVTDCKVDGDRNELNRDETDPTQTYDINSSSDTSLNFSDQSESMQNLWTVQIERRMEKIDRKTQVLCLQLQTSTDLKVLDLESTQTIIERKRDQIAAELKALDKDIRLIEIKKMQEKIKLDQSKAKLQFVQNEKKEKIFDKYLVKCAERGVIPAKRPQTQPR
ncbi:hypothetical protein HA402_009111 [Bradysia odoriphaga]|nr:hypothetical protein HA402_009111 [Bradysia odoriphaga]